MRKLLKDGWRDNAVLRFLASYLLILALMLIICFAGFYKALDIVENSLLEGNEYLMRQGAGEIDNYFNEIYIGGMQMAQSSSMRHLGQMYSPADQDYYHTITSVLKEYSDAIRYYETGLYADTFIYVNSLDRVLYDNAVYNKKVFQMYPEKWGMSSEEWLQVCEGNEKIPYFYISKSGELFYVFPCLRSMQETVRLATIFFHIPVENVLNNMSFLEDYSSYSFFISQKGSMLMGVDGLGCGDSLKEWSEKSGNYDLDGRMVLSMNSDRDSSMIYTLVLPRQEVLIRLETLRSFICLLLLAAVVIGTVVAYFFSVRSGRPINRIAETLKEQNEQGSSRNLKSINETIVRIVKEQEKDREALQKTFFHNLLKADFLSKAEMRYMAQRAELKLAGDTYYAACLRYFPQIDAEHIDGQTVEEVRAIQILTYEWLKQHYDKPLWYYKRNTLTTIYIIEGQDEEKLTEILTDMVLWLRKEYQVDSCWGVGSPCMDLMYFWKSTEEANTALAENRAETAVLCYSQLDHAEDDSYSLPYSVQEYLMQGLRTGDIRVAEDAMEMIRNENCVRRYITRRQFLKLNHEICELLAELTRTWDEKDDCLIRLSSRIPENQEGCDGYFEEAVALCKEICWRSARQKNRKRSEKIQKILEFLEDHFSDPGMGLGMVSSEFKLSEGYLSSIFKEETGINFGDCLEKIRIENACRLLKEGVLVAAVAEKTGYNSVQAFRRAFKRVKGVSPSEYRV